MVGTDEGVEEEMAQIRAGSAGGAEASRHGADLLSSAVRRQIVEHLDALPRVAAHGRPRRDQGLTARELASVLGLHVTTARFHLDQLLAAGLLVSHFVRHGGAGRPAKKYVVAEGDLGQVLGPDAPAEPPYQVLATLLAESIPVGDAEGLTPEQAGERWVRHRLAHSAGHRPEASAEGSAAADLDDQAWRERTGGAVVDLLQEWGYTPELTDGEGSSQVLLTLRGCPFLELARAQPAVVCGVHRGLLRGAMAAVGEPDAGVSLRPFVERHTCQAVLTRSGAGPDGLELPPAAAPHPPHHPARTDPDAAPRTTRRPIPDLQEGTR